jgi:hypothetical protein
MITNSVNDCFCNEIRETWIDCTVSTTSKHTHCLFTPNEMTEEEKHSQDIDFSFYVFRRSYMLPHPKFLVQFPSPIIPNKTYYSLHTQLEYLINASQVEGYTFEKIVPLMLTYNTPAVEKMTPEEIIKHYEKKVELYTTNRWETSDQYKQLYSDPRPVVPVMCKCCGNNFYPRQKYCDMCKDICRGYTYTKFDLKRPCTIDCLPMLCSCNEI